MTTPNQTESEKEIPRKGGSPEKAELSSESESVNGSQALEKDLIDPDTAGDDGIQVDSSDPGSQEWNAREDVRRQQ
jgi:hypothetical protein